MPQVTTKPRGGGRYRDRGEEQADAHGCAHCFKSAHVTYTLPDFGRVHKKSCKPLKTGAPGRIRTCGPKLRRLVLYPAELRARVGLPIGVLRLHCKLE